MKEATVKYSRAEVDELLSKPQNSKLAEELAVLDPNEREAMIEIALAILNLSGGIKEAVASLDSYSEKQNRSPHTLAGSEAIV